jgi:hypothetical protein
MSTAKELESIRKKSIFNQEFLHTTKSTLVNSDINKLVTKIRRQLVQKKSITVIVLESDK